MVKENVVELKPKLAANDDPGNAEADERAVIMATLENIMNFQGRLEQGMRLMTDALAQTQSQVRSLEKEVAALKRKRPAILNASGERAN